MSNTYKFKVGDRVTVILKMPYSKRLHEGDACAIVKRGCPPFYLISKDNLLFEVHEDHIEITNPGDTT